MNKKENVCLTDSDGNYMFECVKTEMFHIKPFSEFVFRWKKTKLYDERPYWVYVGDINMDHDKGMPLTKEQEKIFVDLMKKHKTEVFVDDRGWSPTFYTLTNSGMTPISHERITREWNELKNK